MQLTNIGVEDILGWHEDDWCNRLVKGRLRPLAEGQTFFATLWVRAEGGRGGATVAALSCGMGAPLVVDVPFEVPTTLEVAVERTSEGDVTFRLYCENLLQDRGGDERELSFVLVALGIR